MAERVIRTVDLFSGAGGLSLGFELHRGLLRYETVMALDNKPVAVRTYNANMPSRSAALVPTARVGDMTWFSAPSEVLLYYLTHFALHEPDAVLADELRGQWVGMCRLVRGMREIDLAATALFRDVSATPDYGHRYAAIDNRTFNLQIVQSFLRSAWASEPAERRDRRLRHAMARRVVRPSLEHRDGAADLWHPSPKSSQAWRRSGTGRSRAFAKRRRVRVAVGAGRRGRSIAPASRASRH